MQQAHQARDIMVFGVHATTMRPRLRLHQLHLTSIFHKTRTTVRHKTKTQVSTSMKHFYKHHT
jgi:hypothetical protein